MRLLTRPVPASSKGRQEAAIKPFLTFISIILTLAVVGCWGSLPGDTVTFGGQVQLQDGSPLGGVEVIFFMPDPPNVNSDGIWVVLTDVTGWYSDDLYTAWEDRDITITPSHPAYVFSPERYSLGGAYEDRLDLDFTAIPFP